MDLIRGAGVEVDGDYAPIYKDELPKGRRRYRSSSDEALPQRAKILIDLRPGSRLVVAGLDRLGVSWGDIMNMFDKVDAKECSVLDAATGIEYSRTTPRQVFSDAAREAEAALRRENLTKARKVRAQRLADGVLTIKGGNKGWRPDAKTKDEAKRDWLENVHVTQSQMEEKYGVKRSTLRRHFGERGMPRGRPKSKQST